MTDSGGFALFDDAFRRRNLQQRPAQGLGHARKLQEALDFCLCPHGTDPQEAMNISAGYFLDEFNANIIEQAEESQLEDSEPVPIPLIETVEEVP